MPELTDEQIAQALSPPQQGKFDPVTTDDGSLSDSAIDQALNSPDDKPFNPRDVVVKNEINPIAHQYTIRFDQSKKQWRDNTMWFKAFTGGMSRDEALQKYGTSENDRAISKEIEEFNDDNQVYELRNILHPTYAGMDLAQSSIQMGVTVPASIYGAYAGAALGGAATVATGGLAAPSIPVLAGVGGFLAPYTINSMQFIGSLYKKYSESGVDDATAKRMALAGGLTQALSETFGDLIVKGVLTKRSAKVLLKSPQGKILIKESMEAMLKQGGILAGKAGVEGLTEVGEDVAETIADHFATEYSQTDFDPNLKPTFGKFVDNIGKSFIAGSRAGGAQISAAKAVNLAWRAGTDPKNLKEALTEIKLERQAQVDDIMRKRDEEKFATEESKKKLEGQVSKTSDPRDAVTDAEFEVSNVENEIDSYLLRGEDIPTEVTEKLRQAKADLRLARNNLANIRDEERISKFSKTLNELEEKATQSDMSEDERSEVIDKAILVGKELRETQAAVLKRKTEQRIKEIDREILDTSNEVREKADKRADQINDQLAKAEYELMLETKVRIRNLTTEITKLSAEVADRRANNKPTKQVEDRLDKATKEREYVSRSINKQGNITKVALPKVKKIYEQIVSLNEERDAIESEDTPEFQKLNAKLDALQEERAYLDLTKETVELGGMSSEDFDSMNISISNRSGKKLANLAAKAVLKGYMQGKREIQNQTKMRKAFDNLIRLSNVSPEVKAKLPKSSSVTFKNLATKLDQVTETIKAAKEKEEMQDAVAKLDKALKRSELSGRDKTKVGPEVQQILDWFRQLSKSEPTKVPQGDESLFAAVQAKFADVDFKDPESIETFADFIKDLTKEGISAWDNVQVRNKIEATVTRRMAMDAIQGGDPIDFSEGSNEARTKSEKWWKSFGNSLVGWVGNLHNMMQDAAKPIRDKVVSLLDVAEEVSREDTLRREWTERMGAALRKATGLNSWQIFWKMVASNTDDKKKWLSVTYKTFDGETKTETHKPGNALQMWMYLQTPSLKSDLNTENGYTTREDAGEESTEAALERALFDSDADLLKMGKALMDWYDDFFPVLAAEYKAAFGRELQKDENYGGFVTRYGTTEKNIVEQYSDFILSLGKQKGTGKHLPASSSTFERQLDTGRAVLPVNAFINAQRKLGMDLHWVVWRKKAELLSRVFFHPEMQALLKAKFSDKMVSAITQHLTDMTHGYMERDYALSDKLSVISGNLSIQKLGGWKPEQLLKQFTGVGLAALEMGPRNFFEYLNRFIENRDIDKAIKRVQNSDWYKDRFYKGSDNQSGTIATGDPVNQMVRSSIENFFLWFMLTGDKGVSVVLGDIMTNFYQDSGFSEEEALAKAGLFVNKTQSTSRIDMLSQFQRDKRWGIFSKFMQQPGAMYEFQLLAWKDFLNHPSVETFKNVVNTEATIRTANVLFVTVGAAFKMTVGGEDDEDKRQQTMFDVLYEVFKPAIPTLFNDIVKMGVARTYNTLVDVSGAKLNKADVWEFRPPVLALAKDSARLLPALIKLPFEKTPQDRAVKIIDIVMLANRLAALSSRFGFIPIDPTAKAIKKAVKKE